MAVIPRLVLEFADANDNSIFFSWGYGDPGTTSSAVKQLMNTIINNKEIFSKQPVSPKSAKVVLSTEAVFDIF